MLLRSRVESFSHGGEYALTQRSGCALPYNIVCLLRYQRTAAVVYQLI